MIKNANATSTTKTLNPCGCGCGQEVRRRFAPGHDAKLKSVLTTATKSADWWVREPAVNEMVAQGWGHYVDSITLATTPVRNRLNGKFVETRHASALHGVVVDSSDTAHSVWYCPSATSHGTWTNDTSAGWKCATCIHTHDLSEETWNLRKFHG